MIWIFKILSKNCTKIKFVSEIDMFYVNIFFFGGGEVLDLSSV